MTADILLIDDDPLLRKLYDTALTAHGVSLETASSGEEGLERLTNGLPKLAVLDVMMPKMDGIETCRRIRETYRDAFPILFLTATDATKVVRGVLEAGGDDFVVKGSPLSEVLGHVRFWLSTPLKGLPASIRRAALNYADHVMGKPGQHPETPFEQGPGSKLCHSPANAHDFIAGIMARSGVAKAGEKVHDPQVHAQILGYLVGIVGHTTGVGLRQALTFPERYTAALNLLAPETRAAGRELLPKIDQLLEGAKIAHAVKRGRDDAEAWENAGQEQQLEGLNL